MKTFIRRLVYTLAALAALLGLFHLVENLRGRRAWAARRQSQEALGMRYAPASYLQPSVADADNFARAPSVAASVRGDANAEVAWALPEAFHNAATAGDWRLGKALDPAALPPELRDLDAQVRPFEARLAALREALRRPACRLSTDPLDPDQIPALLGFRARMRVLRLRALAELRAGKSEAALEDTLDGLRLVAHLQREPHLISQLLRLAVANMLLQPVWEGLRGGAWNEAQLARLEAALAPLDLLDSWRRSWRFERAGLQANLDGVAQDPANAWPLLFPGSPMPGAGRRLALRLIFPRGWVAQNQVTLDRLFAEGLDGPLDPAGHRLDARAVDRATAAQQAFRRRPYNLIAHLVMPPYLGQQSRMARIATGLDHARVACALERYRLARKAYPENLAELAPAYLPKVPQDLVTGEPLRYARTTKGYRLHSTGWDGKDDGGRIAPPGAGLEQGDWVWSRGE